MSVTEQAAARRDPGAAGDRLHHFLAESPVVLYALRVEAGVPSLAWVSENLQRLLGYTVDEALAPGWWLDRLHPEEREAVLADLLGLFASGRLILEYRFRQRDGKYLWLRDERRLLRDGAGRAVEIIGSWSDATGRNRAERDLFESVEEYRLLFDSNPHPMWVFDILTLAFLAVNDAAVQLYGYSRDEFLGMTIKEIRPPEEVHALLEYVPTMQDTPRLPAVHVKHRKKDGSLLEVEGASNPIQFHGRHARLVLANDVSEKKRMEAQLLQAQKMDAVGRLAGGVAHDFNNSLGVILGYTELLLRQASEPQRDKLEQILKATHHASGLTRQLLAFSRKQIVDPKVLDLNAVLADLEKILGRLIGEHIDLAILPDPDLGQVKADPGQLEQVVINLCVNARDAMPDGGLLRIQTANVELDAGHSTQHEAMLPGRYVMVSVSDTGCGISKEILSKIFEPFFTTKEQGKGTGLGLAMVYGIMKQALGYVWVYSEAGQGTTFRLYLPRIDERADAPDLRDTPLPSRGWETILLVEDEASLRAIARQILEEHGYRVFEAASPSEAIDIAHDRPEPIHLLLTDVVMPVMNGRALAESLGSARPGLKVLYMSGYTDDLIVQSGVLEAGTRLISKPFTALGLLRRVSEVLGDAGKGENA